MRRLGGSRWRLRRTRCAMGFERQLVAESKTGRELANWNGGLVIVEGIAGASRGERAAGRGNVSRWGRQTSASACRNTSSGRLWWTRYEESKQEHVDNSAAVNICIT